MSAVLGVPAPMIGEAEQQLRSGLTSSGGGGAPISALRIMNLFLPRLGRVQVCKASVPKAPVRKAIVCEAQGLLRSRDSRARPSKQNRKP